MDDPVVTGYAIRAHRALGDPVRVHDRGVAECSSPFRAPSLCGGRDGPGEAEGVGRARVGEDEEPDVLASRRRTRGSGSLAGACLASSCPEVHVYELADRETSTPTAAKGGHYGVETSQETTSGLGSDGAIRRDRGDSSASTDSRLLRQRGDHDAADDDHILRWEQSAYRRNCQQYREYLVRQFHVLPRFCKRWRRAVLLHTRLADLRSSDGSRSGLQHELGAPWRVHGWTRIPGVPGSSFMCASGYGAQSSPDYVAGKSATETISRRNLVGTTPSTSRAT